MNRLQWHKRTLQEHFTQSQRWYHGCTEAGAMIHYINSRWLTTSTHWSTKLSLHRNVIIHHQKVTTDDEWWHSSNHAYEAVTTNMQSLKTYRSADRSQFILDRLLLVRQVPDIQLLLTLVGCPSVHCPSNGHISKIKWDKSIVTTEYDRICYHWFCCRIQILPHTSLGRCSGFR